MSLKFSPSQPHINLNNKPEDKQNKQRVSNIQNKLQTIDIQRQLHDKQQIHSQITRRIMDLQTHCTEQAKQMQEKIRVISEQLADVRVKENQHIKKCQLSRKMRWLNIHKLQKQIWMKLTQETNEKNTIQEAIFQIGEQHINHLQNQLSQAKKQRKQSLNGLQAKLQNNLSNLHFVIDTSDSHIIEKIQRQYRDITRELKQIKEIIEREEKIRQKSNKNIGMMIGNTIQEIKKEILMEKQERERNKSQIVHLVAVACQKMQQI